MRLTKNQKALIISISSLTLMSIARLYHFHTSFFMMSDEGLYLLSGILSAERKTIQIAYRSRIPYQFILALFGLIFNLDSVYTMGSFALGFDLFCSIICVFLSYKIINTFLPKYSKYGYIYILLIPTLIIFDVATVAVLTESISYAFMLLGVYSLFRAIRDKSIIFTILSGASFGLIFFMREPYAVISVGALIVAFSLTLKKVFNKKQLLVFCLFALLFFRVPTTSSPVNLTNYLSIEIIRFSVQKLNLPELTLPNILARDVHPSNFIPSTNSNIFQFEQKATEMYVSSRYKGSMSSWSNLIPSAWKIGYTIYATLVGLIVGWNPIVFALAIIGFYLMQRRQCKKDVYEKLMLVMALLSILVFMGSVYVSAFPSADQLSAGITFPYGSVIRLSHPSLLATFLILPALKIVEPLFHKKKNLAVIFLIGIVTVVTFVVAINSFQVQWSSGYINRLSLSYQSPYVKASDYFQTSGRTLIFGGVNIVQLSLFTRDIDNIFLSRPPASEAEMEFLLSVEDWDNVLIYGITHYTADPALEEKFPFFWRMLQNQTEYKYCVVWEDGESYLLKLIGVGENDD